jgi:hypothetical protein
MKKHAAWIAVVIAASSIGCATYPPLDPTRPVDISPGFLFYEYEQDDQRISRESINSELMKTPAADQHLSRAFGWFFPSFPMRYIGAGMTGYALGASVGSGNDPDLVILGSGLGMWLVGALMNGRAELEFRRAVEAYNATFEEDASEKRATPEPTPVAHSGDHGLSVIPIWSARAGGGAIGALVEF